MYCFALRSYRFSPLKLPFACTAARLLSIVYDSQTHAQQRLTRRVSRGVLPVVEAVEAARGAPEIDGLLDEEVWQSATPVTEFARNDAGGRGVNIGTSLTVRPTGAATFSLTPSFGRTHAKGFYVTRQADVTATATHGFRYVFNELVQTNVDATVRMDLALSPDLSMQLYAQPFVASADYQDFKEWSEAGTFDFIRYGLDGTAVNPVTTAIPHSMHLTNLERSLGIINETRLW